MYNDPSAIKMLAERVVAEMGWDEMMGRRISEQNVQNLVRAMLHPSDNYSEASQRRLIEETIIVLRRIFPIRRN